MAENFINAKAVLGGSATTVYTCPAGTKAIVIGCQVANVDTSNRSLDFWWVDSSNSDAITFLAKTTSIPTQSAYEPISGKLVLEAGDSIRGFSSLADKLEATVSVLELS
jgi:hypothetical protein